MPTYPFQSAHILLLLGVSHFINEPVIEQPIIFSANAEDRSNSSVFQPLPQDDAFLLNWWMSHFHVDLCLDDNLDIHREKNERRKSHGLYPYDHPDCLVAWTVEVPSEDLHCLYKRNY
eukprot:7671957-Ditylum_brightwellii.AAC.1